MAFFEDLTPYTYHHPEEDAPNTVNIGWLDTAHPFPTGQTSDDFRAKLGQLCERRVNQTRGLHPCYFCKGRERPASSSEMRVVGRGRVYAAPSLVHHYVVAHDYRPPDEFIAAVLGSAGRGHGMGVDREAGHIVMSEADFTRLVKLPRQVGFRVYARSFGRRMVWLIGTKKLPRGTKWRSNYYPFGEASPLGSRAAATTVQELARPFCAAVDSLAEYNRTLSRDCWPVNRLTGNPYKPLAGRRSAQIGELSLGQQMSSLLGMPVFSFLCDRDNDDEFACVNEPGMVRRIYNRRGSWVLEYADGQVSVSPECPDFLSRIPGISAAATPMDDTDPGVVAAEVDAFVGAKFASGDEVVPDLDELVLIGERTVRGNYRRITTT